jgi:type IV pilus assembly protein PilM
MNFKKILRDTLTIKFDKAFGLDVGDRSVEIIELEKVFKFSITTYGRSELDEGIIDNGRIIKPNILAEEIKKVLKNTKPRVSTNKVIISLPESQVFVKCLIVDAKLKSSALVKDITDRISLSIPFNLDKTYWDFIERPLPEKKKKMIMFISVPKDIANNYVKLCNSIGLEVVSLCSEALSLARAILKSSNKQSLIIDMGSCSTNLSFFDSNDKINMSITIPTAGEYMTEVLGDRLGLENKEAELLKIKNGFKDDKNNKVRPILLPILENLMLEVDKAINHYEKSFNQKLDDIYLIGGSSLLPGILEVIKSNLKRDIHLVSPSSNISLGKKYNEKQFPLFVNVIGLGMLGASGEFRDLNLLNKMPKSEVNSVNKLNLFNMGYLSKVNTLRTILNNRFILIILIILIGIIFAILYQQANNYGYASVYTQ